MAMSPEFVFGYVTVIFALVMALMQAIQPNNVPLNDLEVADRKFPFWAYGIYSILAIFIIFSFELIY